MQIEAPVALSADSSAAMACGPTMNPGVKSLPGGDDPRSGDDVGKIGAGQGGQSQPPAATKYLKNGASIINIGSVVSRITPHGSSVYTGTKGAVDAITGVLSRELGARKIRVNALNPGLIETEGTHSAGFIGGDFEKWAVSQTPLGRVGQPDDIASIAVFLASDESAWLTGEHLLAGGGTR